MKRKSGVLLPVFSLPSEYGIGDFGKECYKFIDFLKKTGQRVWQILPLVQTGYGNSPYSSVSSESFNPYFISPELLEEQGLLNEKETAFSRYDGKYADYGFLYSVRFPLLKKAFSRFDRNDKTFRAFTERGEALDYALFMTLKYESGQKHFYEWEHKYKYRDKAALKTFAENYKEEISFWQFVQYEAEREWFAVKKYAAENGVEILGDMPLYVAHDSVDVWKNPELFKLDENLMPTEVAGVPPDYFCADGQLWGNPVYDYAAHAKDGFKWWTDRLKKALKLFDLVRIDHFRGIDRFYKVKAGESSARVGEWEKVPSDELFAAIHKETDKTRIVAEDLGIIDDGVRELLKKTGYPGMRVLSFAFNGESGNPYLPENVEENSVCYTATHDNDTLKGLIEGFSEWDKNNLVNGVKNSLRIAGINEKTDTTEDLINAILKLGFNCKSKLFVAPIQDLLSLGSDYRINEPGTVKPQNWAVKFGRGQIDGAADKLKKLTAEYKR